MRRPAVNNVQEGNDQVLMRKRPPIVNQVSDETGQFDMRFRLWRKFCADRGVPVDCLPSTLSRELQEEWQRFKEETPHTAEPLVE